MKTLTALLLALMLFLVGCGETSIPEDNEPDPTPTEDPTPEEAPLPEPDPEPATDESEEVLLAGEWISTDEFSPSVAVIKDGLIVIKDVFENTSSLYWVGTAPESLKEGESFISDGDTARMETALMASTEEEKEFTLEDGYLVYYQGFMDVETTVYLEKQDS